MCLARLKEFKTSGIGYKYLYSCGNGYYSSPCYDAKFKLGRWYTDKMTGDADGVDSCHYPTGYHICVSKRGAEKYRDVSDHKFPILKIQYKNVVATGIQEYRSDEDKRIRLRVVVARKIKLLKEVR
jgi:hypothetical protein